MGEGRRDNSSKRRQRSNIEKSSSDTEVVRSSVKNRRRTKEKRWHFIEGLSVDELGRYRRRRVQNHPKDTLGMCQKSISRENLVTEYRRAYRATSEDSILKVLQKPYHTSPEVVENFIEPRGIELPVIAVPEIPKIDDSDKMAMEIPNATVLPTRPALIRRGTSLKREGDEFYGNTEYSSYVSHEGHRRPELARRPTSLKMEGKIGTTTEQCEKFIEWLNVTRPALIRLPTNLKLEGDLETTTENHEKYVPFVGSRRPELLRQRASLKLEGESTYLPEYTDVFRDHNVSEKRMPVFPETHLQAGGLFYGITESSRFNNEPMDKDTTEAGLDEELHKQKEREENRRRKKEEDMRMLVSKLEELKGAPLEVPEYKDAYKNFPRERPRFMRPEDEIGRADGSKIHQFPCPAKFPTKIDQDPEYNGKLSNADRPVYRKPPLCLKPSGSAASGFEGRANFRTDPATSEIRSQYIPYGNMPRIETLRMPANLRLEGSIDLQPEYREAYCTQRGNVTMPSEPRMHRRRDRSLSETRRRDNLWISNNNGEQFGLINAADQQDAFQILNTRIHADSVVGKPSPLETRRGSRLSQIPGQSLHGPTNLNGSSPITRNNRSPSPGYRLHVQNVDDEPRGFVHHRTSSSTRQLSENHRSPLLDYHDDREQRGSSYSPSFGKSQQRSNDEHAFVVLDNARNDNLTNDRSRHGINGNFNATGSTRAVPRNSTPTNWMPPWYDNSKTI